MIVPRLLASGLMILGAAVAFLAGRGGPQRRSNDLPAAVFQATSLNRSAGKGQIDLRQRPDQGSSGDTALGMFPEVFPGPLVTPLVASRINHSLSRLNADVVVEAKQCARAETKLNGDSSRGFERTVQVTMQDPRFLSLVAEDTYDCGAPHPLDNETAMVYDLRTGLPVNWTRYLPSDAVGHTTRETGHPAVGYITWPRMMELIRKNDPESGGTAEGCAPSYRDPNTAFAIWLDAADHALVFSPQLASHFDTAMCAQQYKVEAGTARALGVKAGLIGAL